MDGFFFQAKDGKRNLVRARGLGDADKKQPKVTQEIRGDPKVPERIGNDPCFPYQVYLIPNT